MCSLQRYKEVKYTLASVFFLPLRMFVILPIA
jgi:hypothetical protein